MVYLAFAASATANPVGASNGFTVYADPAGTGGDIIDHGGLIALYVIHVGHDPATASEFIAPIPSCFDAIHLSDAHQFPATIGNSQTGISVAYGTCLQPPIHILTISYFSSGTTTPCCYYPLGCDPLDPAGIPGQISVVDCSTTELKRFYVEAGYSWINMHLSPGGCGPQPPVENTTWGKIKSQYSDDNHSRIQ
jgi:hypothetical protein